MDASAELQLFRRRWRAELARGGGGAAGKDASNRRQAGAGQVHPKFLFSLAGSGMLEAEVQSSPLTPHFNTSPFPSLASFQNEINEVPFFDVQLPYELALKIFQFLGRTELGTCAQVSKTWKVLAEDQVLWFRLCQREGYLPDSQISDFPCWKATLRDCREKEQALRTNWKNRVGAVSQLQYELGKVLCDVHSCDGVVIAG
ncbi:F-box/WD repeat-containing protein 8 [Varanus komodoensis]|nr:F-box/WD repeat-containing protein 8 [Varanus komodoensis]